MEHIHQLRGDANNINGDHVAIADVVPTPHEVNAEQAMPEDPPLTFAEAERRNPFKLLIELYDHTLATDAKGKRPQDPRHHLAELALSSAVVTWWTRWQPISLHHAFRAGASLAEVAAAVGTTEAEAYQRWSAWAEVQSKLIIGDKPSVAPEDVEHIRSRLGDAR